MVLSEYNPRYIIILTLGILSKTNPRYTAKITNPRYTGRIGENSRQFVYEEYKRRNLELKYECDAYNDDLPYHVLFDGEQRLVIPYTLDQNDMKFCVAPGFTSPDGFFTYLKNAFDVLYEEGLDGSPKLMSIGLHCRVIGKPGRLLALKQFMDYIQDKKVWVCTREEVADHWKSKGL
jgi:allantoinase